MTVLPDVLAMAQAVALTIGQPSSIMLFRLFSLL